MMQKNRTIRVIDGKRYKPVPTTEEHCQRCAFKYMPEPCEEERREKCKQGYIWREVRDEKQSSHCESAG